MSQWFSEQYAIWREQLSAATSAVGPLRPTQGQTLRLLVRKMKDDMLLHLHDFVHLNWSVPVWVSAVLMAFVASTVLLLVRPATRYSSRRPKLQLPKLHMQKGWDYPALLAEGARRYPNSPYIITHSGHDHVVFPSSSFDEVKRLHVSQASTIDWFNQTLWQGWAFAGTDNRARYHTVAIDLSRALPSRVWMRQDSAKAAFETVLGPRGTIKDWRTVPLWKSVQNIVVRTNATGLLGSELGTDPRWLKATQRLHTAMMFGIVGSHFTPRILRPLVAPVIFVPARMVDRHMASILRPMVERELKAYEAKEADGWRRRNSAKHTISTILQYSIASAVTAGQRSVKEKFPLTEWLLNRYRSGVDRLSRLLRDYIVLAFESAVSSSSRLYFMLAELATRPELVEELRDEVERNTDELGRLPLSDLAELRKMDSFMLESARAAGGYLGLFRRVQKPIKLSIGPELPPGTLICVDKYHFARSQTEYKYMEEMDPLRFYRMRQNPGHEEMHQFAMPGPNNTIWGNGTQACPGRTFATITMKVVLAYILTYYDIQLLPGSAFKPKGKFMPNGSSSPDTKAKIMVRDRQRL